MRAHAFREWLTDLSDEDRMTLIDATLRGDVVTMQGSLSAVADTHGCFNAGSALPAFVAYC
jgi:hypothetical protein